MNIEKGMLVSTNNEWYIVVRFDYSPLIKKLCLSCICDNANNKYYFEIEHITNYLTLKEIGYIDFDSSPLDRLTNGLDKRGIPYDVILEVITGVHDNRFEDE